VSDGHGLTSTATVDVTVTGIADGISVYAGNGNDTVVGTSGEDRLDGGNGNDNVYGLDGHDWLTGGNGDDALDGGTGNDRLEGERGDDRLTGGTGADLFLFGKSGGSDVVTDYQVGVDKLVLQDGIGVKSATSGDVNHDGIADLTIAFSNDGGHVTLLGVSQLSDVTFGDPSLGLTGMSGGPEHLAVYHTV
jgi:Ca2+-binding RTX toxin-like protein